MLCLRCLPSLQTQTGERTVAVAVASLYGHCALVQTRDANYPHSPTRCNNKALPTVLCRDIAERALRMVQREAQRHSAVRSQLSGVEGLQAAALFQEGLREPHTPGQPPSMGKFSLSLLCRTLHFADVQKDAEAIARLYLCRCQGCVGLNRLLVVVYIVIGVVLMLMANLCTLPEAVHSLQLTTSE